MKQVLVSVNNSRSYRLAMCINSFSVAVACFPNLIISADGHDVIA
jgi:hypothetical protein